MRLRAAGRKAPRARSPRLLAGVVLEILGDPDVHAALRVRRGAELSRHHARSSALAVRQTGIAGCFTVRP